MARWVLGRRGAGAACGATAGLWPWPVAAAHAPAVAMARRAPWLGAALTALALAGTPPPAAAATRVLQVSPQGEVATVRQVLVRFDVAAVPAGDPQAAAPAELRCNGQPVAGRGRWLDASRWAFDLDEPLAAGQRCSLELRAAWQPLTGPLAGPTRFAFATGAPAVLSAMPWPGGTVEEDQHFVLRLNGAVDEASVERFAACEVEGLGERLPVRLLRGAERERVLQALRRGRGADAAPTLLLACQRPLPPGARVRLVWGAGIAAAADASLRVRVPQRFQWTVRPRLLAEFSCERENARAGCLPLRPLTLSFNAPVPRALLQAVRLEPLAGGAPRAPRLEGDEPALNALSFPAPLPENTRFRLVLPAALVDEAGRALANAASFPLEVTTGPLPPLARFAAAPFAVIEAPAARSAEPALLPLTLRHVQADLAGAQAQGALRTLHLGPATPDATLLQWIARLQRDHADEWRTRAQPLLAREAAARVLPLPGPRPAEARATEVIGLPLPSRGLHVVEAESRLLGAALLEQPGPLHARTAALVTNLGVHFKRGRSSSLVWVTTLDRARPVPGAQVVVNDCRGQPLWSGRSDAQGLARIPRGFDEPWEEGEDDAEAAPGEAAGRAPAAARPPRCTSRDGLFVTARATLDGQAELGLVFSRWHQGIEPWRFGIATAEGTTPDRRAHTVFSRTLLRVGEPLHMKHFVRDDTERGLGRVPAAELPDEVVITHLGSDTVTRLPLPAAAWAHGRAAETTWTVPATAPLGLYDVALQRGERRLGSGQFRVEAFRVPLVDARLTGPAADVVAPGTLAFEGQLAALAGGPLRDAPATLSAVLRPRSPGFAGLEDFGFDAPRPEPAAEDGEAGGDGARVVASRLPARTGADGRARFQVPGLPALDGPAELQVELGFADLNGETQTVSRRWRLWPAAVVVGLRVPGWASVQGELQATAVVLDTGGRPLAGRDVVLQGRQHRVLSTRTRLVGGLYAYDNRREVQALGELCRGRSDARGRVDCRIPAAQLPAAGGEIELIASARDDAGRESRAAGRAWLSRGEAAWFAQDDDDRVDLLPESREVEPGQRVRLQLRTPFARATALVTVEREGVIDARLVTVTAADPHITVQVPAEGDERAAGWSPNIVVSALLLRGRVREAPWWSFFTWGWREPGEWWQAFRHDDGTWRAPTALVDLAKPSFRMAATELRVGRRAHRLDVAVSVPQPSYKVRETVPVTVRVSRGGRPVAGAEVAFAAVDEGLLALAPNTSWQLLEGLLAPRPWGVVTATAQGEIVGRRHYGRKAVAAGGGGGANATRELFDTLLLWRGRVPLDANGQARIDVPLNDSLTRFRLVAIADAGEGLFGTGEASVAVSQDLQLLPGLPPVARAGDRFEATLTVRNSTGRAMPLRVALQARAEGEGGAVAMPALPPQTLQLAAGAAQELRWPVQVPEGATRLAWEARAEETAGQAPASDRVAIVQAISHPVPLRVWQASLQALDGALSLPQAAPAGTLPGRWELRARLVPSLAGVLPEVQDWFRRYPFNCLEQQASRVLALGDAAGFERLAAELPGYLDADGLANFFPPAAGSAARGDDKLTAYLVSAAHAAGRAWPEPVQARLLDGLTAFVEGRLERPGARRHGSELDVRKLAALEALARHGRVAPRQLGSIAWTPAVWPTSALLDAWSLHRRVDGLPQRAARLDELQRLLRSRLLAGGTTLRFADEAGDRWWWLLEGPDANAARLVLLAADEPAWRAELPLLMSGALARRQRGGWDTTTANLWGALALQRFAAVAEAGAVGGRSELVLGTGRQTLEWSGAPAGGSLTLPGPATPAPLQARHDGPGRPWLALQTWAAVPLQAPLSAGYRLTRQVEAVQPQRPGVLSRGDVLRVTLEIEAPQELGWVVLADPVPAGATLLGSGLGRDAVLAAGAAPRGDTTWPVYIERGADSWRAYFDTLPRGRHLISYTLRLNTAGRFVLPPARVEAMYAPEHFAELPLAAVEVQP